MPQPRTGRMARDESRRWLTVSRWWHGSIEGVALASVVIPIVLIFTDGADANSGDTGTGVSISVRLVPLFSYSIVDSNFVVAIVCLLLVADPLRQWRWWDALRLKALLAITNTGIAYAVALAPVIQLTGWAQAANVGFHYIVPWRWWRGGSSLGRARGSAGARSPRRSSRRSCDSFPFSSKDRSRAGARIRSSTSRRSGSGRRCSTPCSCSWLRRCSGLSICPSTRRCRASFRHGRRCDSLVVSCIPASGADKSTDTTWMRRSPMMSVSSRPALPA